MTAFKLSLVLQPLPPFTIELHDFFSCCTAQYKQCLRDTERGNEYALSNCPNKYKEREGVAIREVAHWFGHNSAGGPVRRKG